MTASGGANAAHSAQKQPWNGSTRASVAVRRRQASEQGREGRRGRDQSEQPHHRCTSPACQRRRHPPSACTHTLKDTAASIGRCGHQSSPGGRQAVDTTRAMIERAFDTAMATAMLGDSSPVKAVAASVESIACADGYHATGEAASPKTMLEINTAAKEWRVQYLDHRRQRDETHRVEELQQEAASEISSAIGSARLEYEKRKLAMQSLRARVDREIQFLQATALALDHREAMMDDAFAVYERCIRSDLHARNSGARAV